MNIAETNEHPGIRSSLGPSEERVLAVASARLHPCDLAKIARVNFILQKKRNRIVACCLLLFIRQREMTLRTYDVSA